MADPANKTTEALVLVPRVPTKAMVDAACQAMRRRREEMDEDWFPVSNKVKAMIRWEAMLKAWEVEGNDGQP